MAVDLTSFNAMLKTWYTNQRVENLCNEEQPFLAWLKRMENFGGDNLPIPIQYSLPVGHSAVFTTAQAYKNGGQYKSFSLTRKRYYSLLSIDNETIQATGSDKGAWAQARVREVSGMLQGNAERTAKNLVTNHGFSLARGASLSGSILTLTNAEDTVHFWVGMPLESSTADGTSGSKKGGTPAIVSAVDRDAGTVTASFSNITSFAATDYLFAAGDFGQGLTGLDDWLPAAAPTSTLFHGVDRSVDPTRLGGIRFDATSMNTLTGIEKALARARREQAYPETIWVNHQRFTDISLAMGAQYERSTVKVGDNAYDTITFNNGGKKCRIMADQNIPYTTGYALRRDTWKFYTLGKAPNFLWKHNGQTIAEPTADAVEIRAGWYGELGCTAPGQNMRITFANGS